MSRMILPVPHSTPVLVADLVAGDWISDRHEGPWHHVLAVTDSVLTVGEADDEASSIPVGPGAMVLCLAPEDAPRRLRGPAAAPGGLDGSPSPVQTPDATTETKINGALPGSPDTRSL